MLHHETQHQTHDEKQLYLQAWLPEGEKKAAVLIVHGLAEHSGRYAHLATKLVQNGYAVYSFDGRGHGKSDLPKPAAYFSNIDDYLADIDSLYKKMKTHSEGLPCFIYGHSMGGCLTTQYVLKYKPEAKGILLSGPALVPGEDVSPFLIKISAFLSWLAPKLKAVKLDSSKLSHDPKVIEQYIADPLVYSENIPARTGAEIIRTMKDIRKHMEEFNHPVIIMHGTADILANIKGSKMLYEKASSADKTLKLYDGFYHELINEVEKEKVMEDMLNWMETRLE